MPRIIAFALVTAAALVVVALICDSDAAAGPVDDIPQECLGPLWSQVARGHLMVRDPSSGELVDGFNGAFHPGLYKGASGLEEFLGAIGFDGIRIEQIGCSVPIPGPAFDCIDFSSDPCPSFDDADDDGYLDFVEELHGSDPGDPNSTPEATLIDEQTGSQTCSDRADNDLDGHTDRGDPGCRLTCRSFSTGFDQRCTDADGDGWLNYVEDLYESDPNDVASTPESPFVGDTCEDGVDNDGDGDADGADTGCGGGEISECIDFDEGIECEPF